MTISRSKKKTLSRGAAVAWLDKTLRTASCKDVSNNGLQIDAGNAAIRKIAFGVDASVRFFREAARRGADFAVCHHGISWGGGLRAVAGSDGAAVRAALECGISLYAVHLPLDANRRYGNNFSMARALGLRGAKPAYEYHGMPIGCAGFLPRAMRAGDFLDLVRRRISASAGFFAPLAPDAGKPVRMVGICSGGGGFAVQEAYDSGHDVLLTGEAGLADYTAAENLGACVIAAGHYRTEKWGVRALARAAAAALRTETEFIDFDIPY